MLRLLKVFIVSVVAVYVFMNGPAFYTTARFWIHDLKANDPNVASAVALIQPIRLPVSDIETQPLPNEATLIIDRINVSVPIVFGVPAVNQTIYDNLGKGVVHYSPTVKPGLTGPAVIFGHSSLYPWQVNQFGAPFALIGKIQPGDRITIRYSDGRIFNFRMKQSIVFNPLQNEIDPRFEEIEQSRKPVILLVTCWPVNTTKSRLALEAELE